MQPVLYLDRRVFMVLMYSVRFCSLRRKDMHWMKLEFGGEYLSISPTQTVGETCRSNLENNVRKTQKSR